MKKGDLPIVVERSFQHSVQHVWSAITDHSKMVNWYFDNLPDFKAEIGFETKFNVKSETQDFIHIWKVTDVNPPTKIVYDWRYEGIEGDAYVVFDLVENGGTTHLIVSCHICESFPQNIPEFKRESCVAGWDYFLNRLKNYLEK